MKFGPKTGGSYFAKARERWGERMPEWIAVLAREADAAPSQGELGTRLGLPAATVSAAIGKTYPGKMDAIEARVRGVLMSERVTCPVLGSICRKTCMDVQKQPFSTASPARAQLYVACRKPCPNFIGGK